MNNLHEIMTKLRNDDTKIPFKLTVLNAYDHYLKQNPFYYKSGILNKEERDIIFKYNKLINITINK